MSSSCIQIQSLNLSMFGFKVGSRTRRFSFSPVSATDWAISNHQISRSSVCNKQQPSWITVRWVNWRLCLCSQPVNTAGVWTTGKSSCSWLAGTKPYTKLPLGSRVVILKWLLNILPAVCNRGCRLKKTKHTHTHIGGEQWREPVTEVHHGADKNCATQRIWPPHSLAAGMVPVS